MIEVEEGDRIYVYSDGVIETRGPGDAMFGQERLEGILEKNTSPEDVFVEILDGLARFRKGEGQDDDITMIEVTCDADCQRRANENTSNRLPARAPAYWQVCYELSSECLRSLDPLLLFLQNLMDVQGLHSHRERLYTIFAELFANALEHGLLRLDSKWKKTSDGFAKYYAEREKRLEELEGEWIRIRLTYHPLDAGGELTIHLEDSGPGFDYETVFPDLEANTSHSGRGIPLVRSLCTRFGLEGDGNCVEAVYCW